MRLSIRMVTASFVFVTALAAAACEHDDSTAPGTLASNESLRVSISPRLDTLAVGRSVQPTIRVYSASGESRDHPVDWSSDNPTVASVSSSGLIAAIATGTSHVIATAGGPPDTMTVVVIPGGASSISITPGAVQVLEGESLP